MKKLFFLFLLHVMSATLAVCPALAAGVNMRAKQPCYGTEFDVYRTADMPANWFKTYDGYYVTRRIDANWVYGRVTSGGLAMTDILVGSIDPHVVTELGGIAPVSSVQAPVYVPPEPENWQLKRRTPRHKTGREKLKDPAYQEELKEIIKGLDVEARVVKFSPAIIPPGTPISDLRDYIVSTFKQRVEQALAAKRDPERFEDLIGQILAKRAKQRRPAQISYLYDYSYHYLTRNHFPTKVPLDFHILHDRESGHVEFYVTVGVKGGFVGRDIIFYFDYDEEKKEDSGQRLNEDNFYLLMPLPNDRDANGLYGLRLATTSRSTWLPTPTYMALMQKISRAKRVWVYSVGGDKTDYNRKTTRKLLGIIEIAAIDQKNRFAKSLEARYETYKKIVELEERWQGPFPDETERPFDATHTPAPERKWRPGQILEADEIYNLLTAGEEIRTVNMLSELTGLFGDPQITEFQDTLSNIFVVRMTWEAKGDIRIDADYRFNGGSWNENRWVPLSEGTWKKERLVIDEQRENVQQAFASRVREFTEMLGNPKLKQSSMVTWLIGDYNDAKLVIRRKGNSLFFSVEEPTKIMPTSQTERTFWSDIIDPVK